tara:strand:- start:13 stop:249 length:237 start_codon:yes stop_codon:yes gene_type:complete
MAKVKIDDKEYEFDDLSQEAKNQLQAIQYVDQEVLRAQMHVAALQTARNAYGKALQEALGAEGDQEPELDLPDDLKFD